MMSEITPNEIARSLGVTALRYRNWLRSQKAAGGEALALASERRDLLALKAQRQFNPLYDRVAEQVGQRRGLGAVPETGLNL